MLQLNYKKYGTEGQTIVILHGFLGSLDNWHSLATAWGNNGFTVYALDQRNHGKSPHTEEHSIRLMSDDLLDFLNQHQLNNILLLGHSMGGKVAMQFTLEHPERVAKLIVADIAPRAYKHGAHDAVFEAIFNVDLYKITHRKEAEEAMMPYLGDFGTRQFVLKSLERTEAGYQWKFNIITLHKEYDEAIKAISSDHPVLTPTLFIRGELSLYIQAKDEPEIKALFPHATFATIPQAGHWIHADQPQLFTEVFMQFIRE